jgi:hypothetical protein
VPRWSIEDIASSSIEFSGTGHNLVASSSVSYIFNKLTEKAASPLIGKVYNPASSFLHFELFSPIDMQIIAPDGKRLGRDFNTDTELDEIPNAFYSGFETDNEYAVIVNPLPGTYTIKTIGTGNGGHFTIVGDYIDTLGNINAETSGTTTPGQIISNNFNLSGANRTFNILYRWDRFLQPINDTAHQVTASTSVFKGGTTVPVKLQLKNASGAILRAATAPVWLTPQKGGAMSANIDEGTYTTPATVGSSFAWDPTTQQYVYNWSTKGLKVGYWYKISVKLDDGTTQWTYVGLR